MRGLDERTGELFSYVDLEARVRADHPLRVIGRKASGLDPVLAATFSAALTPPLSKA